MEMSDTYIKKLFEGKYTDHYNIQLLSVGVFLQLSLINLTERLENEIYIMQMLHLKAMLARLG